MTTVCNRWYFGEIRCGNIVYLPTVIDLEEYPFDKNKKSNNKLPIIVWIGTPITAKYIDVIEPVLQKLYKEIPFKLRLIGTDRSVPGIDVENLQWIPSKVIEYLSSSDIGIMPLDNSEWKNGKCGSKIIQYMASGLPVVASDAPANREIIRHGETGFIALDEKDWYEFLKLLFRNIDLRLQMGKEARKIIEKNYVTKYMEKCML